MKFLLLIIISVLVVLVSCKKDVLLDDELTISRINYTGSQLKTDGYYYLYENNKINDSFILFRNGIFLDTSGASDDANPFEHIESIINYFITNPVHKERKYMWGVFQINDSKLIIERWSSSQSLSLPAYHYEGSVINDTTLIITRIRKVNDTEYTEKNETYHFKQYSPKPDSTNNFIN